MRLLARFVAVLLLVGFVGAYFWWIVAGLAWLAVRAYPVARAEFEADARRRAERAIALIQPADQQHALVMADDDRGVYGRYPP
jgi:hypothetical protein